MSNAESRSMSAASYLEASSVLISRRGDTAEKELDQMLADAAIAIVPVTVTQAKIARAAFRRFGKGRGAAAGLNLGDLFSYALAKQTGEPLLFKGGDFSKTDIGVA
jgi:ribonuclease VapC